MFTATILLLNRDPVFQSKTWEVFDMIDGLSTKIVRRAEDMVSLVQAHSFDLLVFDDEREGNLQMAITFRHHFPHHQFLAVQSVGMRPKPQLLAEAKRQKIRVIRRSDSPLFMKLRLRRVLKQVQSNLSQSGTAISSDIGFSLTGDLTIFPPPDVLQMACMTGRSGRFNFISSHGKAEVFIEGGAITHAVRDKDQGEPVLAQICRWDHGRFYFEEGRQTAERTVTRKFDHVIVDALKEKDEAETLQSVEFGDLFVEKS